jgi:hypothetical protein
LCAWRRLEDHTVSGTRADGLQRMLDVGEHEEWRMWWRQELREIVQLATIVAGLSVAVVALAVVLVQV